jgi:hypothetical protein
MNQSGLGDDQIRILLEVMEDFVADAVHGQLTRQVSVVGEDWVQLYRAIEYALLKQAAELNDYAARRSGADPKRLEEMAHEVLSNQFKRARLQ